MKPKSKEPGNSKPKAARPDTGKVKLPLEKSVIHHSMDGIVITNEKGIILEWSPSMERITGLKRDDVLKQEFCDVQFRLVPEEQKTPQLRNQLKEGMRLIVEDNDTLWSGQLQEVEIQRTDGERRIIETIPFHLKTNLGVMTGSIHSDVTERRRAEVELDQKMREMVTFVNNIPHMAWLKDTDSNFILANQAFTNATGMSPEYLKSNTCTVCFGKEAAKKFKEDDRKVMKGKKQITLEETIVDKDGKKKHLETTKSPIFNDTGDVVGTVGIAIDITERKKAEEKLRESEERYRTLFEISGDGILIADVNTKQFKYANPTICRMLGYTEEEMINLGLVDIHPKESIEHVISEFEAQASGAKPLAENIPCLRKDGKVIYADFNTVPAIIDGIKFNIGIIRDITERKQTEEELDKYRHQLEELVEERTEELKKELFGRKKAEEALRESEEKFRTLFRSSTAGIAIATLDGKFLDVNDSFLNLLGYTFEELNALTYSELTPEKWHKMEAEMLSEAIVTGQLKNFEKEYIRKDGTIIPIFINTWLMKDQEGKPVKLGAIVSDITERKIAEESLRKSEEKFKGLVETSSDWIWEVDENGVYTYVSPKVEDILGYKPEEVVGKTPFELMPPEEAELIAGTFKRHVGKREPIVALVNVGLHKDGRHVVLETSGVPILDEAGNINGYRGMDRDITNRKRAEDALLESEQKLRNVFESVSEGIFAMDLRGVYTEVNKRILDMYALNSTDEIVGESGFQFVAPNDVEIAKDCIRNLLEDKTVVCQEFDALRADGSEFNLEISGTLLKDNSENPIGIIGIARDITERKRVEEELRNTERLESLSFLAGGIAHDFNNLLGGVFGNIQLAMVNSSSKEKIHQYLERAMHAMQQAKDLTHQLLTFSSGGAPIIELVSIRKVLTESVAFALSGSTIHPTFSIDKNLWTVEADQGQIHQVLNNILLNARQAMPEGGTIEINAVNINVIPDKAFSLNEGMYVRIAIKDNGIGMPESILEKIFDPFFTTKQSGSGLGLSICYSIVKKHNGHITVDSNPGAGSVFTVYLPASEKEFQSKPEKQNEILQGKGRILIMDDELIICETLVGELELMGYGVEVTNNGDEAIQAYKEAITSGTKFDAVILDLTVPGGKGGKETITELKNIDPDIKAVVSSGYSDNPVIANPEQYGFMGAIEKPFVMEALSQVLHDLLIGNNNAGADPGN